MSHINDKGVYAGIYTADGSTATDVTTGATYTKVNTFAANGLYHVLTPDYANDKITITHKGRYLVNGAFSFTGDTNNVLYRCTAFLGGVEQDHIHWLRKIGTASDAGSASFSGVIDVTTIPIDLDVRIRHDYGSTVKFVPAYMNLNLHKIGD